MRLRPEVFLPKTESLVKPRANALAADPFAVHAHALGHPRGRFRVVAAHLRALAPRPGLLVSPILLQVGFRRQRRGASLAVGDFLPLQLSLVPSMVPRLPLLRLRLVHAPERERGGGELALRGAHAVGQREEVEALAVWFPSRELAAVASPVGEGEPTPAVLVPVGVHLPAEDALAVLVELLDQAGEFAVVPEARAPGAVAREVLGVSLYGVVGEGTHHAIPSRGQSLERGLGHRPVFTVVILILTLILILVVVVVVRREVEGALPVPCAAPELALVPGAVVVESQDARAVRATLVVHLTVVSAGEVLVDEGFDRDVVSP